MLTGFRTCRRCNKLLHVDKFTKSTRYKAGHYPQCNACREQIYDGTSNKKWKPGDPIYKSSLPEPKSEDKLKPSSQPQQEYRDPLYLALTSTDEDNEAQQEYSKSNLISLLSKLQKRIDYLEDRLEQRKVRQTERGKKQALRRWKRKKREKEALSRDRLVDEEEPLVFSERVIELLSGNDHKSWSPEE